MYSYYLSYIYLGYFVCLCVSLCVTIAEVRMRRSSVQDAAQLSKDAAQLS